jgi:succinoglycan biosynthesis protein ExoA
MTQMARPSREQLSSRLAVIVPVRNEVGRLAEVVANIERQTLQPSVVVFADGCSEDGSRQWLDHAAETRPWLRVVDNPSRIIPTALNLAVAHVDCEIVARMDTHVDYEDHYLEAVVDVLRNHPELAGAGAPYTTKGRGPWGEAIAAVLRRPWGHGGAKHQSGTKPGPVPHTRWTVYRTAAIRAAGGWDTQMLVNEDEEMDVRARNFGDIWLVPTTTSTWYVRNSVRGLTKQMWRYGAFRALTLRLHPETLQARVLAPPTLTALFAVGLVARPRFGVRGLGAYLAIAGSLGAFSAWHDRASWWRGAVALPIVHLVYGAGLVAGWITFRGSRPMLDFARVSIRRPAGYSATPEWTGPAGSASLDVAGPETDLDKIVPLTGQR